MDGDEVNNEKVIIFCCFLYIWGGLGVVKLYNKKRICVLIVCWIGSLRFFFLSYSLLVTHFCLPSINLIFSTRSSQHLKCNLIQIAHFLKKKKSKFISIKLDVYIYTYIHTYLSKYLIKSVILPLLKRPAAVPTLKVLILLKTSCKKSQYVCEKLVFHKTFVIITKVMNYNFHKLQVS